MQVSRNDYMIIIKMLDKDCTTELKSLTLKQIQEVTNLSINKIRISMNYFKEIRFVREGAVDHTAKTYYITKEAISKINELLEVKI